MTLASDRLPPECARHARLCALLALGLAARTASADQDACTGFTWNVVRERALFASAPQSVAAGREPGTTPLLAAERLYELKLGQQGQVTMLLAPGKQSIIDGAYAGLARLQPQQSGAYRISIDQSAWIDVVADGHMVDAAAFQGRPGCLAPHKIVQYLLPAGRALLLQFSAAAGPHLRVAITHVD
jgi:hypothetical protein